MNTIIKILCQKVGDFNPAFHFSYKLGRKYECGSFSFF